MSRVLAVAWLAALPGAIPLAVPGARAAAVQEAAVPAAASAAAHADSAPVAPPPDTGSRTPRLAAGPELAAWRFPAGERATYAVTFGPARVGEGRLAVEGVDTLAGLPAYRLSFELEGGPFFYRIDDRQVSWVALDPLRSLRFDQRLRQGSYRRDRRYLLDHGAGTYTRWDRDRSTGVWRRNEEHADEPMPPAALDEIAYLYLARLLPLRPGETYRFERYFEAEGNPVVIEVLRREKIRTPAGRFETVVVRPIIRTSGMFGEGGRAEVFLSDDDRRAIVKLTARMKVGVMEMFLTEYEAGSGALIPAAPAPETPGG